MNEDAKHTFGRYWYKFITDKMNRPLVYFLEHLFDRMPEPTHENVKWPLCHALIDIRDEFFQHEHNKIRGKVERAVFNIIIIKYQYDPYYHKRIDWILLKLMPLLNLNPDWLYQAKWLESDQWWKK